MIAGHFGFAAAVKSRARDTPLWALMLATVWMDVIFVPLFLAHIETIQTVAGGASGGYGEGVIYADYTHSIVGAIAIAVTFGLVAARPWGRRVGTVLASVVFSHWLLDLVVHRADMPVLPANVGNLPRLGFGVWRWPAAAFSIELILVLAGAYLYGREALRIAGTRDALRARRVAYAIAGAGVATLLLNWFGL
jgi:membrane-bound metal-dependent hydrolase YbcI (DUF457 family)